MNYTSILSNETKELITKLFSNSKPKQNIAIELFQRIASDSVSKTEALLKQKNKEYIASVKLKAKEVEEEAIKRVKSEIATRDYIEAKIADVRTEIAETKLELKQDIADVRAEIADVRAEIADVRAEINGSKVDLMKWVVTTQVAVGALIVAALKLL